MCSSVLLTSEYDITLKAKVFIASNECVLCWRQTLLTLEMNAVHTGDEHFSAGDEHVQIGHSDFSHTHTYS